MVERVNSNGCCTKDEIDDDCKDGSPQIHFFLNLGGVLLAEDEVKMIYP